MSYEVVTEVAKLPEIALAVASAPLVGLDIETAKDHAGGDFDPMRGRIRLVQVRVGDRVWVVDAFRTGTIDPLVAGLREAQGTKVGHGLKYEQKWFLYHHGLELGRIFDTHRASEIAYNGRFVPPLKTGNGKTKMAQDLWSVEERELGIKPNVPDLSGSDWSGELSSAQLDYAAGDVAHLFELRERLLERLGRLGLLHVAALEFCVVLPEAAVELNGFPLDRERCECFLERRRAEAAELRGRIARELPHPDPAIEAQTTMFGVANEWNPDSPDQVTASLRRAGVEVEDTQELTLLLASDRLPAAKLLIDFRAAVGEIAFAESYLESLHPVTGRIHPDYWSFLRAGRYACSGPNIAQVPRRKEMRALFAASAGKQLVIGDWKNIEMCIIAEFSNDPALVDLFRRRGDAHKYSAAALLGKPEEALTKEERQQAKPLNFGFSYGMRAKKMVGYARKDYGVTLTEEQGEAFRHRWFELYHDIAAWHERALREGHETYTSRTVGGRLRYLARLGDDGKEHRDRGAENEFLNTPVQGTGADGLKAALRAVWRRLKEKFGMPVRTAFRPEPRALMVHHVHDEIVLEVEDDDETKATAAWALEDGMRRAMELYVTKVPVLVDVSVGGDWAEKS